MYWYFPHKQALFYALNQRDLGVLAAQIEVACLAQHGAAIGRMVQALVTTYRHARTEQPEATRALYRSVVEIDSAALIGAFASRGDAATAAMLGTVSDATRSDPPTVNLTLLATEFGTIRNVFARDLPANEGHAVQRQPAAPRSGPSAIGRSTAPSRSMQAR